MDVRRIIDWLSIKQARGLSGIDRPSFLDDVQGMPCVCCFGEPDFLGMFDAEQYTSLCTPENDGRIYFYMLCFECAKRVDKKNIFEKIQAFSCQLTN